jgi:hypothetical protein
MSKKTTSALSQIMRGTDLRKLQAERRELRKFQRRAVKLGPSTEGLNQLDQKIAVLTPRLTPPTRLSNGR